MAITSVGYDGTISEVEWAGLAPHLGAAEVVVEGMAGTILSSPDRGVRIGTGVAVGHGVRDISDTNVTVQCGSITSGTRWDTICLRRNWGPTPGGTSSFVVVAGNSTRAISNSLQSNPGVMDDHPLFLARVQAGSSVVVELVDLRAFGSKILSVSDLVALPSAPQGTQALVSGRMYTRVVDTGGSLQWADVGYRSEPIPSMPAQWVGTQTPPVATVRNGILTMSGRVQRTQILNVTGNTRVPFTGANGLPEWMRPRPVGGPGATRDRWFHCAASLPNSWEGRVLYDTSDHRLYWAPGSGSGQLTTSHWIDLSAISWFV